MHLYRLGELTFYSLTDIPLSVFLLTRVYCTNSNSIYRLRRAPIFYTNYNYLLLYFKRQINFVKAPNGVLGA